MFGRQKSFQVDDVVTIRGWKEWGPAKVVKKNADGTYHVAFLDGAPGSEILSVKPTIMYLRK